MTRYPRANCFSSRPPIRGFTLVELLVVIAIIALLAAITLPGISRIQITAMRAQTHSNLRQIHAAFSAYATDHRGHLPNVFIGGGPHWRIQLHEGGYLGEPDMHPDVHGHSILGCPIQRRNNAANTIRADPPRMATFGMNRELNHTGAGSAQAGDINNIAFSHFLSPSRTLLVSSGAAFPNAEWFRPVIRPEFTPDFTDGNVDILYADGHTGTIPLSEYPDGSVARPRGSAAWYFWEGIH